MKMFRSKKGKEYALAISAVVGIVAIVGLLLLFTGGSSSTQTDTGTLVTGAASAEPKGTCKIGPNQQSAVISLGTGVFDNAKGVCDASGGNCGKCVELCREFPKINDKFGCSLDGADGFCNPDLPSDPDCCTIEGQITSNTAGQRGFSAINGNNIVWHDTRNGNSDIFMFDLVTNTETQITSDSTNQLFPAINGNKIAWTDNRNGNEDIFMCDLSLNGAAGGCLAGDTKTQITSNTATQRFPAINGNNIVWEDLRAGNRDIFMCDLSLNGAAGGCLAGDAKTQITTNTADQNLPGIDGNKIAWTDLRAGNSDIFMCDLSLNGAAGGCLAGDAKTQITTNTASQSSSSISGEIIVWQDLRAGNSDIFMCDLTLNGGAGGCLPGDAKTQITSIGGQIWPDTDGNKIIWSDNTPGYWAVFMCDLSLNGAAGGCLVGDTKTQVSTTPGGADRPDIDGNNIVWSGVGKIFLADLTIVCPV